MARLNLRANCFTGGVGGSATAYTVPAGVIAYVSNVCLIPRNAPAQLGQVLVNGAEVCAQDTTASSKSVLFEPPMPLAPGEVIQINSYAGAGGDEFTITVQGYTI